MFDEGGFVTSVGASTASGAAAGSIVPGWGTVAGAGLGLAAGLLNFAGGIAKSKAMRKEAAEALRRRKLHDAQVFGQATAAAAGGGVELQESASITNYLTQMKAEMKRQQDWMARAASTNASNVGAAAGWNLVTDLGKTAFNFAAQNNYFETA